VFENPVAVSEVRECDSVIIKRSDSAAEGKNRS